MYTQRSKVMQLVEDVKIGWYNGLAPEWQQIIIQL